MTRDEVDHLYPRWAPDSSSLIYYAPDDPGGEGELWECPCSVASRGRLSARSAAGTSVTTAVALRCCAPTRVAVLTTVARDGSDPRPLTDVAATFRESRAGLPTMHGWRFQAGE